MSEVPYPMPIEVSAICFPLLGKYFFNSLIDSIRNSQSSIYVIQYQFRWLVHMRNSLVQQLGSEIIKAKQRNVDIKIILHQESANRNLTKINRFSSDMLIRAGCDVKLFRTNSFLHTKMWLIDCESTFIGSHNISTRSLCVNEE